MEDWRRRRWERRCRVSVCSWSLDLWKELPRASVIEILQLPTGEPPAALPPPPPLPPCPHCNASMQPQCSSVALPKVARPFTTAAVAAITGLSVTVQPVGKASGLPGLPAEGGSGLQLLLVVGRWLKAEIASGLNKCCFLCALLENK